MLEIENLEEASIKLALDRINYALYEFSFVCKTLKNHNCHIRIQGNDVIISCGDKYTTIEDAMEYFKDFIELVRKYTYVQVC